VDDFGLGREQLALEAGDDELPVRLRLAGIDRRIGAVEGESSSSSPNSPTKS
jgi:hypothetical protein